VRLHSDGREITRPIFAGQGERHDPVNLAHFRPEGGVGGRMLAQRRPPSGAARDAGESRPAKRFADNNFADVIGGDF
jgi:hypothetical protein